MWFFFVNTTEKKLQNWIVFTMMSFQCVIQFWMYFYHHIYRKSHYTEEFYKITDSNTQVSRFHDVFQTDGSCTKLSYPQFNP